MTKKIKNDKDVASLLYDSMAGMGSYIVLAFAAGEFLALFNSSNMSSLLSIKGAEWLKNIGLTGPGLLVAFVLFAAFINLFVGSCSKMGSYGSNSRCYVLIIRIRPSFNSNGLSYR